MPLLKHQKNEWLCLVASKAYVNVRARTEKTTRANSVARSVSIVKFVRLTRVSGRAPGPQADSRLNEILLRASFLARRISAVFLAHQFPAVCRRRISLRGSPNRAGYHPPLSYP